MKSEWILQHGWGWGKECWKNWQGIANVKIADRGYFGAPSEIHHFSINAENKVLVTHSLGLHLLPVELFSQTDILVVIGGFRDFHPEDEFNRLDSKKRVKNRFQKLKKNPTLEISHFYNYCFYPFEFLKMAIQKEIDLKRLVEDLEILDTHQFDMTILQAISKVLFLHGKQDVVVLPEKSEEMHKLLKHSRLVTFENAAHALPYTHAKECIQAINEIL